MSNVFYRIELLEELYKRAKTRTKEIICLNPFARSIKSNKPLFLKSAVRITAKIKGPFGDNVVHYYMSKREHVAFVLKYDYTS